MIEVIQIIDAPAAFSCDRCRAESCDLILDKF